MEKKLGKVACSKLVGVESGDGGGGLVGSSREEGRTEKLTMDVFL